MSKKKKLMQGEGWSFEPAEQGKPEAHETLPNEQQSLKVYEEQRAKGKIVTVVEGLITTPSDLKSLGKTLKQRCGGGGTVQEGLIEIQGAHKATVVDYLRGEGYGVKG